uniref:Uncharacterized protein n=1 Tax=Anguilla anguilla TaxID=7936 RepID=A0A0E9PG23_ANGAN
MLFSSSESNPICCSQTQKDNVFTICLLKFRLHIGRIPFSISACTRPAPRSKS